MRMTQRTQTLRSSGLHTIQVTDALLKRNVGDADRAELFVVRILVNIVNINAQRFESLGRVDRAHAVERGEALFELVRIFKPTKR